MARKSTLSEVLRLSTFLFCAALWSHPDLSWWENQAGYSLILFCFSIGLPVRAGLLFRTRKAGLKFSSRREWRIDI
ncbi:MAG: hypothetical protein LUD68_09230 [Rikenellaceae bacterium]|nr:hypothetical protein [Rikenellaceae bacterium]